MGQESDDEGSLDAHDPLMQQIANEGEAMAVTIRTPPKPES